MAKETTLHFSKMHGLGNDIMLVDCLKQPWSFTPHNIRMLADRHSGVGFDQLITIEPSKSVHADVFCRIFNPDGSEAQQCGNGLRCVARYLNENKLINNGRLIIETIAGTFPVVIYDNQNIAITMNSPTILSEHLVLALPDGAEVELTYLMLGNPHAIIRVDNISALPIASMGAALSTHHHFEQGANIGFMQVDGAQQITLRTYERGAGLTLACGSNASAAVVAGISKGWLKSPVTVQFARGQLSVSWDGKDKVIMQGPAEWCYCGEATL